MDSTQHGQIVSFIWRIADDILRDVFVRGKYRDVILPMTVIRRLDAVLEPTKQVVFERQQWALQAGITNTDAILKAAAGHPFYNTSQFTLRSLLNSPTNLQANFIDYLDGFSPNVRAILEQFEFRHQIPKLANEDRIGPLITRFTDPAINLSPYPTATRPGLDNHAMGTVFEELIRRFNEENNEEAGEHFTPRDVVNLMADLILLPVADTIESGSYSIYDGACGTGGMLTVAEERLQAIAAARGKEIAVHLYGQEVNGETWAISQADLLMKEEGGSNIAHGSTLAADAFASSEFRYMLSNPPYGKSWKADLDRLGGKDRMRDPRFIIDFAGDPEYSLITRSSDGQLMFLANKLAKMIDDPQGSRIAEVHNGSSLFTGDAGQGESNIRRWIIESDWLEAIIALPNSMFYNTGIATYIWVITNRKPAHRQGKVQLIDATRRFTPLRKNLGQKNAWLSEDDIAAIMDEFLVFKESETSKIFPNAAFGYWKVTVDRPLRLRVTVPQRFHVEDAGSDLLEASVPFERLPDAVQEVVLATADDLGTHETDDWNAFREAFERQAKRHGLRLTATLRKQVQVAITTRDETAQPVVKRHTASGPEFEPDPDLRDTEQIPLTEPGGIEGFFEREVWPHVPDAWIVESSEKIGYEVSFTRYFYKPQQLRSLAEIEADIRALELETDGLLDQILVEGNRT